MTQMDVNSFPVGGTDLPEPAAEAARAARPQRALRKRAIWGSFWSMVGYGSNFVFKFASTLLLTHLLFPEAFGLMALVQIVIRGLEMFSDIGVSGSIIRDKRGSDPLFLDTAWTMRLVRSIGLWLCACALAWPAAWFYDEPLLTWMIPVVGLTSVLDGLGSISTLTLQRSVNLKPLVMRQVVANLLALMTTVGLAWLWKSVWVLVIGSVARAAYYSILSYMLLRFPWPRLAWDKAAAQSIFRYGRWIFLSTAITFLLQQGDRAVLGKLITSAELGFYSIAVLLSRSVLEIMLKLNSQVLFPIYSQLVNNAPERLHSRLLHSKLALMGAFLPPLWCLAIFGKQIVALMYDPRYVSAGWMLEVLSLGSMGAVISLTNGSVLLAKGDSFRFMVLQVARGVLLIGGMAIGSYAGGLAGIVVGVAASKIADYPVMVWAIRRYGVWQPWVDFPAMLVSAGVVAAGQLLF